MRVGSFRDGDGRLRLAVALDEKRVLDVGAAMEALSQLSPRAPDDAAAGLLSGAPLTFGWLTPEGLAAIRSVVKASTKLKQEAPVILPMAGLTLGAPVSNPGKFIAGGLNYLDHVEEAAHLLFKAGETYEKPKYPPGFIRFASSITSHDQPIFEPPGLHDVDYEIELCVVIGTHAERVSREEALKYVAGYTICNDLATRAIQFEEMNKGIGIVVGKNFRSFAPLGPWMTTADEIPDPQKLEMKLTVNGGTRQHGTTAKMIFTVAELVSYYSLFGLEPGDLIITGTPAGPAAGRPNPEAFYLKPGDVVEAYIEKIGVLRNPVAASESAPRGRAK